MKGDWVKVNLNQRVRVTLTEEGKSTLARRYAEAGVVGPKVAAPVEMQLWELMGIFGSCLQSPGTSTPFEKNSIGDPGRNTVMAADDTIRILRVIEYTGPRQRVEDQVARSLHGEKKLPGGVVIRAATVGEYPEMLENLAPILDFSNYPADYASDGLNELCQCGHRWGIHESGITPRCLETRCSCQQFRSVNQ